MNTIDCCGPNSFAVLRPFRSPQVWARDWELLTLAAQTTQDVIG
jgi:hypothetical protein